MSVNTKAILTKGTTLEKIKESIELKYGLCEIFPSLNNELFNLVFKELNSDSKRSLFISFSNSCLRDEGISGVWLSLGCSSESIEIMRYLCETFGGYLDENDCDENGFYPINFDLYSKGGEFTKLDLFRNKVISELGFDNINKVMKLFEEFKNL